MKSNSKSSTLVLEPYMISESLYSLKTKSKKKKQPERAETYGVPSSQEFGHVADCIINFHKPTISEDFGFITYKPEYNEFHHKKF